MSEHKLTRKISLRRFEHRHQYRRIAGLIYCLVLTVVLISCNEQSDTSLRIGSGVWPGYEPLYLARSLGYYEESQVNLIEMISASEVMQALRNGLLEGAALTLDEVLTLVQDGVELRIILVMDYSLGADGLLVKPDILELDQLIGKRVAVENTAVGAIILDSALSEAGLSASDIEIVSCTHDEHLGCYSSVSAVVTFEPVTTELLKQGGRQLYDSSKMPGRIVDVLAVSPQVITAQAATLDTLLDGYFKARRYLELPPEDAAMRMAPRQGLTPEEVLASYEGMRLPDLLENHQLLEGNISPLHIRANELATFM